MLITRAWWGLTGFYPSALIYYVFLSKLCVEMHVSMFLVNNLRCGMSVNVYWEITTIYTQFLTLICPRTGVEIKNKPNRDSIVSIIICKHVI